MPCGGIKFRAGCAYNLGSENELPCWAISPSQPASQGKLSLNIGAGPSLRYCRKLVLAFSIVFLMVDSASFAADVESVNTEQKGVAPSSLKVTDAPVSHPSNLIFKPGQPVSVGMQAEDICVTDDVNLAKEQAAAFPDSPDASFILAVALTRTSMVEQALAEVRRARRLAEKEGGPAYFDKMIAVYENMLKDYPNDNRLRYGLAWAYYMKAYVLAKYSKGFVKPDLAIPAAAATAPAAPAVNVAKGSITLAAPNSSTPIDQAITSSAQGVQTMPPPDSGSSPIAASVQPPQPPKDWRPLWVSALATSAPGLGLWGDSPTPRSQSSLPYLKGALEQAPPAVVPQIRAYYQAALNNLDELLQRNPNDVWALVYRAFLNAEYTGNLKDAMEVWRACQIKYPDNPAPYFFLGEGYLKEGNLKESLHNISRAVALRAIGK
jgi:tetratricopeptide (TPR) repeat protein